MKKPLLLAALLGTALVLRLGYSLHLPNDLILSDARSFDLIAWSLASTGQYALEGHPTTYRPPAYVLFMSAVYKIAGHRYRAMRVAQALMGLGLVLLLMEITRELQWDPRLRWAAGWIAAVYPFFIYYESHLIADAYLAFWHAAALLLILRWIHEPSSAGRAAAAGFSLAVICLLKTIFFPWSVLVLAVETGRSWFRLTRFPWPTFLASTLCFLVPLALWAVRNERVSGRFLLDGHGGATAVETIIFHDQVKAGIFPQMWLTNPLRKTTESMDEPTRNAFCVQLVKNYIRAHPFLYARQSFARLKDLWRFYPRQSVQYNEGGRFLTIISLLTEPFLIIAGFFGLYMSRHRWRELYPFYAALFLTSVAHALITGQMRYRLPLMPIMILFASYAVFSSKNHSPDH